METYATVKGQIVIPAKLRRKYGIKNGTKIIITEMMNSHNANFLGCMDKGCITLSLPVDPCSSICKFNSLSIL